MKMQGESPLTCHTFLQQHLLHRNGIAGENKVTLTANRKAVQR